jgi:hypothetical protein
MNGSISIILRILRSLAIVAVLALATVGLERVVAALPQAGGSATPAQAQVVQTEAPTAPPLAQIQVAAQPTVAATVAPPLAQVQVAAQPTAAATVAAPSPAQIEVGGIIAAVDPTAGTITVNDDEGFTSVVSVSAAGSYAVGQDVDVLGTPTGPGGSATTVQAQSVTVEPPEAAEPSEAAEAPEAAEPSEAAEAPEAAEPPEAAYDSGD